MLLIQNNFKIISIHVIYTTRMQYITW